MSVVFLGTSQFAAAILRRLAVSEAHRPALVITRPDRRRGRGLHMASPPVAEAARELGIALEQPDSVNDPHARELIARAGRSDAAGEPARPAASGGRDRHTVVVCAFGALIKEPLLSEQKMLNVHPSLLPRWRGAAPIERAIMAGDAQSGVSIMRLTAGLDSGPVCLAGSEPIEPSDTYGSLSPRIQRLGGELLVRVLDLDAQGRPLPFAEQDEREVTYAQKIAGADRLLDPGRPASELERVVRALHPHIGARVALADGTLLGVHRAALAVEGPAAGARAAGVREHEGRLLLDCAPGVLELLVVQPAGGRAMDAPAYLRGHGLPQRR